MNNTQKTLSDMQPVFDYNSLGQGQLYIKRETMRLMTLVPKEISRGKKVFGKEAFPIAKILLDIKSRLPESSFQPWLRAKTHVTIDVARKYMKVAKAFEGKEHLFGHVPVSILHTMTYLPSSHPLFNRVGSGHTPTLEEVKAARFNDRIIRSHDDEIPSNQDKQSQPYETTIQDLSSQLARVQQQIKTLTLEPQIKEVLPQEILEELHRLREENEKTTKEYNAITEEFKALQQDHEKVTKEKQTLSENCKALSKKYEGTKGELLNLMKRFNDAVNRIYRGESANGH